MILAGIKQNVVQIKGALKLLEENVMFERKDQKTYTIDDFEFAHETIVGTRHGEAMEAGEKIQKLLLDSNKKVLGYQCIARVAKLRLQRSCNLSVLGPVPQEIQESGEQGFP